MQYEAKLYDGGQRERWEQSAVTVSNRLVHRWVCPGVIELQRSSANAHWSILSSCALTSTNLANGNALMLREGYVCRFILQCLAVHIAFLLQHVNRHCNDDDFLLFLKECTLSNRFLRCCMHDEGSVEECGQRGNQVANWLFLRMQHEMWLGYTRWLNASWFIIIGFSPERITFVSGSCLQWVIFYSEIEEHWASCSRKTQWVPIEFPAQY